MKTLSILICSLFLTACGLRTVEKKSVNIHPELQSFAKQFEQKGGVRIDNLNMTFGEVDGVGRVLGFCQMGVKEVYVKGGLEKHIYNIRNIVIDQQDWNYFVRTMGQEKAEKELLSFHELAHCVLGRGHTDQSARSIMRPYHMGASNYLNDYSFLISELFKKPVTAYAATFDAGAYASMAYSEEESLVGKTEFVEPEVVIPHESELKGGCVHELEPEVIHEEETESDPESTENI